jgi:hypothetical protein
VQRSTANSGPEAVRHAATCRFSVVDVSGGFWDDLLSRLCAMQELKMRKRCNSGTLWPGPGVRMACFIVASVECCSLFGRALH